MPISAIERALDAAGHYCNRVNAISAGVLASRRNDGSRRLVRLLYASFEISDVLLKLFIHRIDGIGIISFHNLETR